MKISIVIPTRNRSEFLRYCVQTCLACADDHIEVVVSDNNSSDDTRQQIEAINDPRLVYVNTGQDVSMRQNFEFALEHTTGDYLIYIGDDDGIIPNGLAALRYLINRHEPESIQWRHITYVWPKGEKSEIPGRLKFRFFDFCGPMEIVDTDKLLEQFCQGKQLNYRKAVNIYHGCVKRSIIDEIRRQNGGTYFNAVSPDVNTAFTNLVACQKLVWFRNPVSIAGAGEKSVGYACTSSKKRNAAQEEVAQDFTKLQQADPIDNDIDIRIKSFIADTYTNLCRAIDFAEPPPPIDHAVWRLAILSDYDRFPCQAEDWELLESFFKERDDDYIHQNLAEARSLTKAGKTQHQHVSKVKSKSKKRRRVSDGHISNVADIAKWIQVVTGRPYAPSDNPARAFITQVYRSAGMLIRAKSIQYKGLN